MNEDNSQNQEPQNEPSDFQKEIQILLDRKKEDSGQQDTELSLENDSDIKEADGEAPAADNKASPPQSPLPNPQSLPPKPKLPKPAQEGFTSNNIALVVLLVASAILLMSMFNSGQNGADLPFDKFMQLLDEGPVTPENFDPHIIVLERSGNQSKTVRYSHLNNITVSDYEIRATATRQVLSVTNKEGTKSEMEKPVEKYLITSGRRGFVYDGGILLRRLQQSGFSYRSVGNPTFWQENGLWLLIFIAFMAITFFMIRGIGSGGAMAFGRNKGRLITQEDVNITFNDVAGVEESVDELKEIVDFLKMPQKFQALGGRIPRGVLLVGPPGTGKTLLAKAVAGEAGVPFYSLSGSDFVELYVGVGAARVRDLFEQAKRRNPCIIFIDELDALGKARGTAAGGHDEREQTLNALLVEMDGFGTNSGIIVMAATNRPEILDAALLRPGRFDRQVLVDSPDLAGREAILNVHIKNIKLDPNINLKEIASITSGFVGADLAALVNEAALLAARAGKDSVTMVEFTEGVERVTTGLQKKQRVIRPEEKRRIAVHECGHALAAYFTPHSDAVHKISIIPRGLSALGYTLQRPEDNRYLMTQKELEARIQTFLAGTIAEEMEFDTVSTGAQNDLERATDIARGMVMDFGMSRLGRITFRSNPRSHFLGDGFPQQRQHSETTAREIDQEIHSILDTMFDQTRALLNEKRPILERLTVRLLEKEIIESEELKEVIEEVVEREIAPASKSQYDTA
ncbi:MAG: ATP-dependent zinc metalloprotease FtsH [Planctomycetaceae bacterium]|jgi:cell division protease FtsH|nr:ATP-dependent zinc metalloprotease FtsH [Planctomycetaceae bacterium]